MIYTTDAEHIAEIISNERYAIAENLISSRIKSNYYNPELPEDRLLIIPEAFFTSFKGISDDEIIDLLEKHNFEAFDGVFTSLTTGHSATYEEVFDMALSSRNVEKHTIAFLESELGNFAANQYRANLNYQKIVAENIITTHLENTKRNCDIQKELQEKGLLSITDNLIRNYEIAAKIDVAHRYKEIDLKKSGSFGVPFYVITLDKMTATFSSCVEVRHMFKDKNVTDRIEASIKKEQVKELDNKVLRKSKFEQ